jgi:hypothetical protein
VNRESPLTVHSLSTDSSSYPAYSSVTAKATLCARVSRSFDMKIAAKRLKTGERFDFPTIQDHPTGADRQTVTSTRVFAKPGRYEYWLAYRKKDGSWDVVTAAKNFWVY